MQSALAPRRLWRGGGGGARGLRSFVQQRSAGQQNSAPCGLARPGSPSQQAAALAMLCVELPLTAGLKPPPGE